MKIIMKTRKQLIELFKALTEGSTIGNAKFKYGSLKNIRIINSEIETLKEIEKSNEGILKEYNTNYNNLLTKYGKSLPDGSISVNKNDENYDLVVEKIKSLREEYKDDWDTYNDKQKEYLELLDEDCDFDFNVFEISIDNVPDEFNYMKVLMDFDIIK